METAHPSGGPALFLKSIVKRKKKIKEYILRIFWIISSANLSIQNFRTF